MVASNLHSSVWHIKNKREKSWEKTDFMGVWLEWKGRWKIGRTHLFSPISYQNFISLIWGKNKKEKNNCIQWLSTLLSKKKIIIIKRLIYPSFSDIDLLVAFSLLSFFFFLVFLPSWAWISWLLRWHFFPHFMRHTSFVLIILFFIFL